MKKVLLPVGTDYFKEIRDRGYYYVDKTGLIGKLFDTPAKVHLFTRPRRFGKSLNISMLQSFFELGGDPKLFDGLEIASHKALCGEHQNKYPVVSLLLSDVSGRNFDEARDSLRTAICEEYSRQKDLLNGEPKRKEEWNELFGLKNGRDADYELLRASLKSLIHLLRLEYGKQVVLLIDEYDVPLQKAYVGGYYDDMVSLIRSFFGRAMKGNNDLAFAVMTGCLKISNESIFTGMNNVRVYSVSDTPYDEYFGFTEAEVKKILDDCGYPEEFETTKEWYDGYRFGSKDIYCPWDVVNHCQTLLEEGSEKSPKIYWVNSSSNDIIRDFLRTSTQEMREDFQTLRNGGCIHKAINEHITYRDMNKQPENLWSVMYMTGYLTLDRKQPKDENGLYNLVIPNKEVTQIYDSSFALWLEEDVYAGSRHKLISQLWECDENGFSAQLQEVLSKTVSFYDCHEEYYHGLLTGLVSNTDYDIQSNRENGKGRSDLTIADSAHRRAAVIEVKISREDGMLKSDSLKAIEQIKEKEYHKPFIIRDYYVVICGVAFKGKDCFVRMEKLP